MKKRIFYKKRVSRKRSFRRNIYSFSIAILIALIIRSLFFQSFSIPSSSMLPTLLVGDYLFVSKYSYGYSRYSFPFSLNLFSGRIAEGKIERGDVAVFKYPQDNRTDYIKRVIGLPHDTIQMINGTLHINDTAVPRVVASEFEIIQKVGESTKVSRYQETLPNGVRYSVLDQIPNGMSDNTRVFYVPDGHYFMMGDNRDNSQDSRFSDVGFVPFENFIGRAEMKFYSFDEFTSFWQIWKWPMAIRWSRLFESIE